MADIRACGGTQGTPEQERRFAEIIEKYKDTQGELIPVLHEVQEVYGYLPFFVQKKIGEALGIPMAEVYGVVTFYTQFSLKPKGKFRVSVCMGTACYVKGSQEVMLMVKEALGIDVGECSEDGLFSLDSCRCIGACGLAPVVMVNDDVHGKLRAEDIKGLFSKYRM